MEEFADYGASALISTAVGGGTGAVVGYDMAKSQQQQPRVDCFVAGTLIQSDQGPVPIEDISVGDMVWAWDEDTGEVALKRVVETYVNETTELVHVFVNGEEIVTTKTHPFYSPVKGWTDAVHLRAGDILVLVNGEYVVVEKVQHEILEEPVVIFNFQVQDVHTYYVATLGVLVHNKCSGDSVAMNTDDALDTAEEYLGPGYSEAGYPGSGRFVSEVYDYRQVRIGTTDITGAHGGGPHMNFDWTEPGNYNTFHVYFLDS